jgi:hypothetical protein
MVTLSPTRHAQHPDLGDLPGCGFFPELVGAEIALTPCLSLESEGSSCVKGHREFLVAAVTLEGLMPSLGCRANCITNEYAEQRIIIRMANARYSAEAAVGRRRRRLREHGSPGSARYQLSSCRLPERTQCHGLNSATYAATAPGS